MKKVDNLSKNIKFQQRQENYKTNGNTGNEKYHVKMKKKTLSTKNPISSEIVFNNGKAK